MLLMSLVLAILRDCIYLFVLTQCLVLIAFILTFYLIVRLLLPQLLYSLRLVLRWLQISLQLIRNQEYDEHNHYCYVRTT